MKFTLNKPVIYVARDLERTFGLPIVTKGYYIISNYTAFANSLVKGCKNVLLIKSDHLLDTRELLNHPMAINFINGINDAHILVFKNTAQIEKICLEHDWTLLNPSAELASRVEEKISQVKWLGELKKNLPPFQIKIAKDVKWSGKSFILQFNRAHTGSGTIFVENEKQLKEIQAKFPLREVRVTKYITGPMFTNNNVVVGKKVLCGNINYQITGLKPFTNLPFATIGNDWALPNKILSAKQKKEYLAMAQAIGHKLARDGWKGLFGIDVILEEKTGKLYLIEINARQPASTSFESQLQQFTDKLGLATFTAHISALLGEKVVGKLIVIKSGAQITQKVTDVKKNISLSRMLYKINDLKTKKIQIFIYENDKLESDWVRMQSISGLVNSHNNLNKLGHELKNFSESILNN
ncbi:MAG: ATP-grasp domain-containing protein [Candidatus Magasanikbacteria bacterium]